MLSYLSHITLSVLFVYCFANSLSYDNNTKACEIPQIKYQHLAYAHTTNSCHKWQMGLTIECHKHKVR